MHRALIVHPKSRSLAATHIAVDAVRTRTGILTLRYSVTGKIGDLHLPPPAAPERADGLWQHTCFEAFIRISPNGPYCEFNFAPSTQWAAYRFDGYRNGMRAAELHAPDITVAADATSYDMQVSLPLGARLPADAPWQLGLSAVIEDTDGKSYWALAHPPGAPDFHHGDCFALQLPPA